MSDNARHRLAPLECLPVEIIQDVFFFTDMDLNMPRASLVLSQALSDHYVLSRFCEAAFHPITTGRKTEQDRARQAQDFRQRELFKMKWMTWKFFAWFSTRKEYAQTTSTEEYDLVAACPETQPRFQLGGWKLGLAPSPHLPKVLCPVPNKLLRAPFTSDKLTFLRHLLMTSNASVNWADSTSVMLSTLAKRDAILERNLEAVHLFSQMRRLAKAPNLKLVKFAVIEGGCDRSIVLELMTSAREWGHRRWEDVELDAWIAQETAKGNPKARWLNIKLVELRSGRYPSPTTGDYVGDRLEVKARTAVGVGIGSQFRLQ